MKWTELHAESERLAIEADLAVRAHHAERAIDLYREAAQLEQRALDLLDSAKSRTRSITAVSAVALWYKALEYLQAEKLAYAMLADNSIEAFARNDMKTLVQAIWTESVKRSAGVSFLPGQVLVSVKGGEVVTGGAPLDLILDKVQTIQSLFYRTVEFLSGASHRKTGPPARSLQEACRPWLFQSAPGSYQFSVAIQKPAQPDFFREQVEPDRIAHHFLEIVSASASENPMELEKIVPDASYRGTFLKLARNLAPMGKTFDRIEFRASGEGSPVALGAESRDRMNQQLRYIAPPTRPREVHEELRGILRAVHLDKDWLEVVVNGEPKHVSGLQDAVDDVIGPMVNRAVLVRVVRGPRGKFKFEDIELAE